jgi:hypothetical protein
VNRRDFLARGGAISGAMAIEPGLLWGHAPAVDQSVQKVLVIFKTHLDIGFTDMAAAVMRTYFERFIPGALALAEQIRREHREDRYVWTTGSWLIYRYLEEASPANRRGMERAILAGDIAWHGLPFTTHTELMDRSLFRLGTAYAARLDRRFGRKTVAAKMTDVPGHSRAMVPVMAEAGLEFLHIGVNEASTLADVPPLFVWKSPDGSELTVMYQYSYGGVAVLPGGRTGISISFTSDNQGPHSQSQLARIYAELRKRFPKAQVLAADLNAVAAEVRLFRPRLPVVAQEIGDTWIHGAASDPLLMARFRELSRLRQEWIAEGKLVAHGDADLAFGQHLLCVPEHTWGLSIRTLKRSDAYDMEAFRAARSRAEFQRLEQSWEEKRANLTHAIDSLPLGLAAEAKTRMEALRPERTDRSELQMVVASGSVHETEHFQIRFNPRSGAIASLEHRKTGRQWAGPNQPLGLFSYQVFSHADFDRFVKQYVRSSAEWAVDSWQKPGMEKVGVRGALYVPALKQLWTGPRKGGRLFVADLETPEEARKLGCPHQLAVETFLPDEEPTVKITLKWFRKPACRLPEALWFSFVPVLAQDGRVEMDKMGQAPSPLDVVSNGNRQLHGVIDGLSYRDARGSFRLETLDAFLVSPGRRSLLIFDNWQPDVTGGLHFCLFNNVTGTNYRMWFEEDMQFRFSLTFQCGGPAR